MAIVKVIEIMASSPNSWEDAAQNAIAEASKTLHGIRSIYVKDLHATVENGRIVEYRINSKVSLEVDHKASSDGEHAFEAREMHRR